MENLPTYRLTQSGPEAQEILDQVNLNTVDIEQLKRLYQALNQSEPEIIEPTDTWPVANPEENVIYRVIDRVNTPPQYYSDYMWNGSTMVLMSQYNNAIDNEPTANSNNLVKSGGVYSFVHANGGAYDISAAHAVGGVLATYDDLADALGTNGANVPAAVRKGGMSIKFVLSSDNKYVQFRCIDNEFTTDVTKWEQEKEYSIKEEKNDRLLVEDKFGIVALKIDSDGVKARKIILCDAEGNVVRVIDGTVLLISDIEDSLTSDSSFNPLSAKQGAVLNGKIITIEEILKYIKNENDDEFQIKDSNKYISFKIDKGGLVHLNKVFGHGRGLFAIEDKNGYYAFKITNNGETSLVISKKSFVKAFNDYRQYLDLSEKTDLDLLLPPYLFSVANYCYSNTPLKGDNGNPSKRNYAPVLYLDRLVSLEDDGTAPNVTFLGGKTSMRIANTSLGNNSSGGEFSGTSITRTIKNRVVGEKYKDYDISFPLYVAKNTNLLNKENSIGRKLNILCIGDSETDHGEWSSYIRKLVLMDNIDYKKKTSTQTDVMDIHLIGTIRDSNNEHFTYRGENVTTATGNYNEGRSSWACYTYLRHAKLYTWATVTYDSTTKSILHCAWHELGLFTSEGKEYQGTNADKELIGNTCSGYYTLTENDIDGWVWNNNRGSIGLSNVEWGDATAQNKQDMLTYLNITLLNNPKNPFYSKEMVILTDGDYAFSWDAYYSRYKNYGIDGSVLEEQGTSVISNSYVCTPDFVCMNLGTNDTAAFSGIDDSTVRMGMVYKLAQIMHSQIGCPVIIFTSAPTSRVYMSGVEDGYGCAQCESVQSMQYYNAISMKSLFGTLAQQETNGIYFCPTYWTQRFGTWCSNSYVDIGEDVIEIGTILSSSDVHPNRQAYDDWGYMLYSMINYLLR